MLQSPSLGSFPHYSEASFGTKFSELYGKRLNDAADLENIAGRDAETIKLRKRKRVANFASWYEYVETKGRVKSMITRLKVWKQSVGHARVLSLNARSARVETNKQGTRNHGSRRMNINVIRLWYFLYTATGRIKQREISPRFFISK